MKCPYCDKELYEPSEYFAVCTNETCAYHNFQYPQEIWRDLIAGKKAQDALNRAISEITDLCTTLLYCSGEADNEIQMIQMRDEMVEEAKARIFDKITAITK
nr:MAG TPA: NAD-dependent DNA ligase C4 zinc finger domain [Caudoviricetes sp.]